MAEDESGTEVTSMSVEDGASKNDISTSTSTSPPSPPVKCPDCDICDGSGRILGGLGAIFPWFPVKAYRPCPRLVENGGFYSRSGQGLDEIAFGRDSTFKSDN